MKGKYVFQLLLLWLYVIMINHSTFFFFRNENFYGRDIIQVSTRNKNGVNSLGVPIFVDPINDPPIIIAPYFIILRSNEEETLIFDKEKDKFDFFIRDPDLLTFPGMVFNKYV